MANETASLVIVVDSTGVAAATAQLDALTAAGARAEAAVGTLGTSAAAASDAAGASMGTVAEAGAAVEASVTKAATATTTMGETAAAAELRIKAMVAASLEQQAANAAVAESETSLAERAGLRIEATDAQIAATQAAMAAQDAQATSMEGYIGVEEAATVATTELTAATETQAAGFVLNSRAMNEVSTITTDLVTGQYGRMRRSIAALANASGAVKALFSGVGVAAIALGALGVAAYKGEEAESALNNALISTGNYAGETTDKLNAMAQGLAGGTVTIGKAREAVAALAESGRFTGEQIGVLAQATVDAGNLMGQSVKEVVADFTHLQESPVAASEKLNESMHYLTTTVLQQIIALQQQGDTIGAANLAMNTYADTLRTRTSESEAQLGTLQKAWDSVKNSASFAWDAMLGVGRPTTDLAAANAQYDALLKERSAAATVAQGQIPSMFAAMNLPLDARGVTTGGVPTAQAQQAAQAQLSQLDAQLAQMRAAMKPMEDAASGAASAAAVTQQVQAAGTQGVETLTKLGISLDGIKSKTEKVTEAAAALYAVHLAGGKLPAGVDFNGATADLPEGAGWDKIKAQLMSSRKSGGANPFASLDGLVQGAQVFDQGIGSAASQTQQVTKILALADAGAKLIASGHDIATVQTEVAKGVALLNDGYAKQAGILQQQNVAALKTYQSAIDQQIADKQKQIDLQVASIGMGTQEAAQQQALAAIYSQVDKTIEQLNRARSQKGADVAYIDGEIAAQKASIPILVAQENAKYAAIDAAQKNWLKGASKAFKDYIQQAGDVATQTDQLFTNAFDGMGNALLNFVTTGKLNFTSLATSILTDLAKMEIRILESKALQSIMGSFLGSSGGNGQMATSFDSNGTFFSPYAKGGAFDAGGEITYFASGGVVDGATPFTSGGKLGVLGEAGPEAIMPLTRGADGKLGVQSMGGGSGGGVVVNQVINVASNGTANAQSSGENTDAVRQFATKMKGIAQQAIIDEQRPGGTLWRMRQPA